MLWAIDGGVSRPGRLDLGNGLLILSGGSRDDPRRHELALADISQIRIGRRAEERIGGRPTVVVALRDGRVVAVVGFGPVGTLRELAERLCELTGVPLS